MARNEHDLKISSGDLLFGADDEPEMLSGLDTIAQDIRHRLRASGRVADLVAEDADPAGGLAAIAFEVEEDTRIRPGSAAVTRDTNGGVRISARTMAGGDLTETIHIQGGSS